MSKGRKRVYRLQHVVIKPEYDEISGKRMYVNIDSAYNAIVGLFWSFKNKPLDHISIGINGTMAQTIDVSTDNWQQFEIPILYSQTDKIWIHVNTPGGFYLNPNDEIKVWLMLTHLTPTRF